MRITFQSQASTVPAFRSELLKELGRRKAVAEYDQSRAKTAGQKSYHRARVTELKQLIELYEEIKLVGEPG